PGQASPSCWTSEARSSSSSSATTQSTMVVPSIDGRGRHRRRLDLCSGRRRYGNGGGHAAGEVGHDRERGGIAIGQAQPFAYVLQADPGTGAGDVAEAATVIGHGDGDLVVDLARQDPDGAAAGLGLQAVLDRVLD